MIVTSLKFNILVKLKIENNKILDREIILSCEKFKDHCKLSRMRDIEIDKKGSIYIITDEPKSSLWKISK